MSNIMDSLYDIMWLLNSGIDIYLKILIFLALCAYLSKPKENNHENKNSMEDRSNQIVIVLSMGRIKYNISNSSSVFNYIMF